MCHLKKAAKPNKRDVVITTNYTASCNIVLVTGSVTPLERDRIKLGLQKGRHKSTVRGLLKSQGLPSLEG
jgi:hypothetical protein